MSFKSYAMSKGIYEIKDLSKNKHKVCTDETVCEHINILYDLHERLKGCSISINNLVNKMVEDFKVSKIFLEQDIERYKLNSKNEFENNVSKFGNEALERIKKILDIISKSNYEKMILRSMKHREICVYNVNFNEIQMDFKTNIYVKNINQFCENITEYDYIKFFTKVKRAYKKIDFMKCCAYVCGKEKFSIDSYNFILACVSFPYEFIRVISKYRDLGRELSNYSKECDFDNVLKKDGDSLV